MSSSQLTFTHSLHHFSEGWRKTTNQFLMIFPFINDFPSYKAPFFTTNRYKKKSCRIPWYVIPQKLHLPSKSCHGSLDGSGVWPMWLGRHWAVRSCDSMMESWCFILEMVMVIRMIQSGVVGPNTLAKSCVLLRTGTTGTWGHAMAEDWTQTFKERILYCYLYYLKTIFWFIKILWMVLMSLPCLSLCFSQLKHRRLRLESDGVRTATCWSTRPQIGFGVPGPLTAPVADHQREPHLLWFLMVNGPCLVPPVWRWWHFHPAPTISRWIILVALLAHDYTGWWIWWFQTFFIFPYSGNSHPNWLIFFRGVETTNQLQSYRWSMMIIDAHGAHGICGILTV